MRLKVPPVAEMPAEKLPEFPEIVEPLTVAAPPMFRMPPPAQPAPLFEMVELETERVPVASLKMPPPVLLDVLLEIATLEMVREPLLKKPPPSPVFCDPETVTPEMVKAPPAATLKILKLPLLPLISSEEIPGPVIVNEPEVEVAAISGKAAPRVIVLTLFRNNEESKIISSLDWVPLASIIACLNEPGPESDALVTV